MSNRSGTKAGQVQLGAGASIWSVLSLGALGMLVVELLVFQDWVPYWSQIALLLMFGMAGGLVPAAALAAPPIYAPSRARVGTLTGLMVMATGLGQLAGPPLLATSRVTSDDWSSSGSVLVLLSGVALGCALLSSRFEK